MLHQCQDCPRHNLQLLLWGDFEDGVLVFGLHEIPGIQSFPMNVLMGVPNT